MQTQEKTESPKTPWHNPYVDVKQKHWFAPGVQFVTERHWMQPWQPRRFGPRGVINKQTFYTILHRASCGSCGTAAELFPRGSGGPFWAEGGMNRQDMAVMLFHCSQKLNLDTSARGKLGAYSDASEISEYAQDAMGWAVGTGLLRGIRTGRLCILSPWSGATRAQAATVLLRWWTWAGQPDTMAQNNAMP